MDPKVLARYLEAIADDMEDTAPDYEPVFTDVYQYYGNSLALFTNTIDDLILQLLQMTWKTWHKTMNQYLLMFTSIMVIH